MSEKAVEDLCGRIGSEVRDGLEAGGGSENQDPAALAFDHARNKQPRKPNHGLAIDAHLAQLLLDRALGEDAELAEAGVIHQDVDGKTNAFGSVEYLLRCGGIVEIRNHDADFGSLRGQLGGQGLQPLLAPRRENEFCAVAGQLPRQSRSNARAGPGDQSPFAFEVPYVCHGSIVADGCTGKD